MLELGVLLLVLAGLGIVLGVVGGAVWLLFHLVMLPFTLLGWAIKGILGLLAAVFVVGALAVAAVVVLPAAVLTVLMPIALPALLVWAVWRLARRERHAGS